MKKYIKEIIIVLLQILIFYISPLFGNKNDPAGVLGIIALLTIFLAIITGIIIKEKRKFSYPPLVVILFLPSILIYYNESAIIYAVWFLIESMIGLGIGIIIQTLKNIK